MMQSKVKLNQLLKEDNKIKSQIFYPGNFTDEALELKATNAYIHCSV